MDVRVDASASPSRPWRGGRAPPVGAASQARARLASAGFTDQGSSSIPSGAPRHQATACACVHGSVGPVSIRQACIRANINTAAVRQAVAHVGTGRPSLSKQDEKGGGGEHQTTGGALPLLSTISQPFVLRSPSSGVFSSTLLQIPCRL
jgi:hypothetical protein